MLARQPKETLWSIASRYKDNWQIDVFSAMIAIYTSNASKFNKQHIARLIDGATLVCPNNEVIGKLGSKKEMHAEFTRLNSL